MDRVATAPGQFEPHMTAAGRARMAGYSPNSPVYQTAQAAVDNASIGGTAGRDGRLDVLLFPERTRGLRAQNGDRKAVPDWAAGRQPTTTIGTHQFFDRKARDRPGRHTRRVRRTSRPMPLVDRMIQTSKTRKTSPRMRMFMIQQLQQMVQRPQATLEKLKDDEGREVPYWVNPRTQTLTPAQVPGASQPAAGHHDA